MSKVIKAAAIVGIIGVFAMVAVIGTAAAGAASGPFMGEDRPMMGDGNMGAHCQSDGMQHMMNGNGQPCQNPGMQSQMTQNADGTWTCPSHLSAHARA